MNHSEVDEALRQWAASQPSVKRLWIFGSRVRGEERPESDLDIAIEIFHDDESLGLTTWIANTRTWEADLLALLPFKVDLQQYQGATGTPKIHEALQRSSRLIYETV